MKKTMKYNRKGYKYYVVANGMIESGWEYKEDAMEHKADNLPESVKAAKVYTYSHLDRIGLTPDNNSNWGII